MPEAGDFDLSAEQGPHAWKRYATTDGGASQKGADLWCTYAAVRTLTWLNGRPRDPSPCIAFILECQNRDGGFAWQKGLRSDIWATYYATQVLLDLGHPIPRLPQLSAWIQELATPAGGFGMAPGHPPDIWATYYTIRTFYAALKTEPPNADQVRRWLAATQQATGGLGWSPANTPPDTRACYYGVMAWKYLGSTWPEGTAWDAHALVAWLRGQQRAGGGFVFGPPPQHPCLWATFRAIWALRGLGSEPEERPQCLAWILGRGLPGTGFSRWDDYPVADVWACFSAVGALMGLGATLSGPARRQVIRFLHSCQVPKSGFTYREPEHAGDSLATSALCLLGALAGGHDATGAGEAQQARFAWLRRAHMPYEGGVMYMPGRGAEIRCTLWALAALDFAAQSSLDRAPLARWLAEMQNPDGGFGYWLGRGSDVTATVCALESLEYLDPGELHTAVDLVAAQRFLLRCEHPSGLRAAPHGEVTLSTTCQGVRALLLAGDGKKADQLGRLIPACASKLGGFSSAPGGMPDMASTYQAVLTLSMLQQSWDTYSVGKLLDRIRRAGDEYAWSPLGRDPAGPLATCLGRLLQAALRAAQSGAGFRLPRVNL